jgi:hypothetical protein
MHFHRLPQAAVQGKLEPLMQHLYDMRVQTYLLPANSQQQLQREWHLFKSYSAAPGLEAELHERVQHVLLFWAAKLPDRTDNLGQKCNEVFASTQMIYNLAKGVLEQLLLQFMQQQQLQHEKEEAPVGCGSNSLQQAHHLHQQQQQQQQQQQGCAEGTAGTEVPDLLLQLLQRRMTQLEQCTDMPGRTPAAAAAAARGAVDADSNNDRK